MIRNWLKYKLLYFALSALMIVISIYGLTSWGLPLGIDFKGGAEGEYRLKNQISNELLIAKLEEGGFEVSAVQSIGDSSILIRFSNFVEGRKLDVINIIKEVTGEEVEETRFENVGPSIGRELVKKTYYAIAIAAGLILLWVAYQFKSFVFGVSAILAMFHDSFILIGFFSLFGHFYDAEVDFLFVTALLTTLSFSVHDTIVVYDRIREIRKKHGGEIQKIANQALTETMRRSINNSLTIIFMLLALIFLGGITIRWFAAALLIGTVLGTYSSPFVAVPLLVTWEELSRIIKK
ncbi:MAG: SecF protein [Candidatus Woesebacteria bacterium GW2011_GWB1_43_14]|uniref:Protein-export membrane protein SecF n=1 Tax=Candidatus Woesebacteria bacterium GW2011_GWB1_43_14 TaxID=1618578 RepID=A0A0G1GER5_9BACT|nr:MAG: SecF protein [Candidatus Woesebacteria bacterium GW2011_GWA1_39_11b]KKS78062.1 MAG: SecF protein [Candidatus Woesebacteria bacterium GW2011_GWC1_42_9]KKS97358.1 MAG: SecF protein [Candidatus Woesebacteria bacterium GW2011_GWB1_43_14]